MIRRDVKGGEYKLSDLGMAFGELSMSIIDYRSRQQSSCLLSLEDARRLRQDLDVAIKEAEEKSL